MTFVKIMFGQYLSKEKDILAWIEPPLDFLSECFSMVSLNALISVVNDTAL